MEVLLSLFVVFAEPNFPTIGVTELPEIDGATVATSIAELDRLLTPRHILVWRHGAAFPNDAWPTVRRHLEHGGSLLYLGGEPFGAPVAGEPGRRVVLAPNIAIRKFLGLSQCHLLDAGGARIEPVGTWSGSLSPSPRTRGEGRGEGRVLSRTLPPNTHVVVLEPRLCDTKDFPLEDGSPGSRDAIVRPLAHLHRLGDDSRFPFAAAAIAIDRIRGPFAGGRWTFWLASTPPSAPDLAALLGEAAHRPTDFRIDPTFGCFHDGEQPSVLLRCDRPHAAQTWTATVRLTVIPPDGPPRPQPDVQLSGTQHATLRVPLRFAAAPGLYRVIAESVELGEASTGFWIFDPALFASGDALTFDSYTLRRNGRPEPVVGTTVMSATVHRDFLFEPNAAVWDDTFAELASLKINLIRTGVWSAYRKIALDPGVIDEAWLRALEAYYLTARKHGIPVMFTFFAFLPESFSGENPYFDPRAIEGQRAFLAAVATRFAPAKEMLWDLINEPSFSSPSHLWKCRPNGDEHERRAFLAWLKKHFSPLPTFPPSHLPTFSPSHLPTSPQDSRSAEGEPEAPAKPQSPTPNLCAFAPLRETWQDTIRQRWRLLPDDAIGLPTDADFADRTLFENAKPYRAADYLLFAQESFTDWALQMRSAIRDAGSSAAITVGQDEGGLTQRPSPLFHHPAVEFTSMHTWWLNDTLLWDGLAAKAPNKPLLISETGVMNRELLSGSALRTPDDAAKLLSRKIGYAFASGAFGVVQWCYDVNPYMASDNEVAIGLRRADGSYKPELRVLREFAEFITRNRERFDSPPESDIVVVIPTADVFSPRDHATTAVQRAVDVLVGALGLHIRLVPDHRLERDLGQPKAIFIPACRGISDPGWRALQAAADAGTRVVCTGWFECDDAGLPAARLGLKPRPLMLVEHTPNADCHSLDVDFWLEFPRPITESWYAAETPAALPHAPLSGENFRHHPLPLEWSNPHGFLTAFYDCALDRRVSRPRNIESPAGVFIRRIEFRDAQLLVLVNESSAPCAVAPTPHDRLTIPPGECRMLILDATGDQILDRSHPEAQ